MQIDFFESFLIILAASLFAAIALHRAKVPTIVAHMVVGAIIGPFGFQFIQDPEQFRFIAELGVVFLLFSLGLEFSLPKLLASKSEVFGLGGIQVLTCTLVFAVTVWFWGSGLGPSLVIAGALALSSTAIVTRELTLGGGSRTYHGRLSIGILLFQDLVAIVFLILVPVLGGDSELLVQDLGFAFLKGVALFAILISVGKWILPPVYDEIGRIRSEEIFVLATLVLCLLSAWITHAFHLSMALGGFVTGMMLGDSPFKHQIESDIRPFKEILLGVFFVVIGMSLNLDLLSEYWFRILCFTLALIVIKGAVVSFSVWSLGHRLVESIKVGLILAQAGEFALALITLALLNQVLPQEQASFTLLIAMFSMLVSPLLVRKAPEIAHVIAQCFRMETSVETKINHTCDELQDHVILGGFGRVGETIAAMLEKNDIPYVGLESSSEKVRGLKGRFSNIVFGDCTKLKMLEQVHIENARLIILTFKSLEVARASIENIRNKYPNVSIFARCYDHKHVEELILMGANKAMPEMVETSLMLASEVLTMLDVAPDKIYDQIQAERERLSVSRRH